MKTQNIKSEIIAKAGLTKAEIKDCAYLFERIESVKRLAKAFKADKKLLLNNAGAEFADSRFKLNAVSERVALAHCLICEHCAKLYFRAYKAA